MESENIQLSAPIKILIVDDSRAIQAIIKRAISHCGYEPIELITASDGEQAIEIVENNTPHLVVTDWHMPRVTGLEMLQTMRQKGKVDVRVGFVTTERTPAMLNEAKANGASFILHKPFDDAVLIKTIRSSISEIMSDMAALEAQEAALGQPDAPVAAQPQAAGELVPLADMQELLTNRLGNIPFRLIANEKMSTRNMTPNNLLGLYASSDRKVVYCIGVMDANAVCIVGGGSARKTPMEVRAAMANGVPDALMLEKAHHFLGSFGATLCKTSSGEQGIVLAKASMVKSSFSKFEEVMRQQDFRSDFRLSIPGYGDGRIAFFLLHR